MTLYNIPSCLDHPENFEAASDCLIGVARLRCSCVIVVISLLKLYVLPAILCLFMPFLNKLPDLFQVSVGA
ncbi:hypothetical protein A0H81_10862 [Grifola frondosa]|uniref:Uncharacterized protein n=1 Tax=Grifola frondosa TaxID=5627 RepID=A0A1C7LX46_GRIFR|nr:hypothetical protein A0H81_10862 [Grifola frondosa]